MRSRPNPRTEAAASGRRRAPVATVGERRKRGKAVRRSRPRDGHGEFKVNARRDAVSAWLAGAPRALVRALLPIKYGRMAVSPFAFFRGSARIMAADLAALPDSGIVVQICGDAHVRNLGAYAAPEGHVVFDINDFDETARAPFEWDLRRLAASFVLAGREAGESDGGCRAAVRELVRSYREAMESFAELPLIELARFEVRRTLAGGPVAAVLRRAARARPEELLAKLTVADRAGARRFADRPPVLAHVSRAAASAVLRGLARYRTTLGPGPQHVFDGYRPVDVAFKVVGTGSVGTRDYVVLAFGNGERDPLFLQVKQEVASAYRPYRPGSEREAHEGRRVALGQLRMQTVSDPLLGWTTVRGVPYLVRQLADHKASVDPGELKGKALVEYATVCGEIFAKGHARTGDAAVLSGYCGRGGRLDAALARFAVAYADQATADFARFTRLVRRGAIPVERGV